MHSSWGLGLGGGAPVKNAGGTLLGRGSVELVEALVDLHQPILDDGLLVVVRALRRRLVQQLSLGLELVRLVVHLAD